MSSPIAVESEPEAAPPIEQAESADPTRRIAAALAAALLVLVVWYALADRWTPYVSNASADAYVAQIAPRVSGQVVEVWVDDNATVTAGQPLFQLDPSTFETDIAGLEANRELAGQQAAAARAAISTSHAQLANARAQLAQVRAQNLPVIELAERGVYAPVRGEQAREQIRAAQAAVAAASAEVERVRRSAGAAGDANAQVRAAESQLLRGRQSMAFTTVTAPADGYITNLQLTDGQFLQAGAAGMTFVDPERRWIIADFRENQLGHLEPGDPVEVIFDAEPGRVFRGRVESIAWGVSVNRPSAEGLQQPAEDVRWFQPARRIPVRIVLENEWPEHVRLGSQASVVVHAAGGLANPVSWIAWVLLRIQTVLSFLH